MSSPRQALRDLLTRLSYRVGHFTLASGRPSPYLIDVKRTALTPQGGRLAGIVLRDAIRVHWPEAGGVGGRTLGADPLAICTALQSLDDGLTPLQAFIVRKETKGHGSARLIEMSGELAPGTPVVVLEDVVTTGSSALAAAAAATQAGLRVAGVLALVDREEGGSQSILAEGLTFHRVFGAQELSPDAS